MIRLRPNPRSALLVALFTILSIGTVAAQSGPAATTEERALHALKRLTFGPRPGDVELVARVGVERWIEQQLHPERIADKAGDAALSGCPIWTQSNEPAVAPPATAPNGSVVIRVVGLGGFRLVTRDSARKLGPRGSFHIDNSQLVACRLARVEASEQQLLEVLTDFWQNHFSVHSLKLPRRESIIEWDRAVIRANALGRFRDLLGAVAHSPVMLAYLDNATSSAPVDQITLLEYAARARPGGPTPAPAPRSASGPNAGLNENYARELLELHTMGVDGGYSQADVIAVARAFTGWSHTHHFRRLSQPVVMVRNPNMNAQQELTARLASARLNEPPAFAFDSARHDAGEKTFLGHTLKEGRGLEDAEQVLDIIARHPSTARFLARKLAVRFVSDEPPAALVERAARTFLDTNGDIRAVVRTIVTSPEFFSRAAYGAKIKSPLELVLSARRALAAPVDTAAENVDLLIMLDQPPFGYLTPEGWPETGADWMNAGALMARMKLAMRIGRGELPSIPVQAWPQWKQLADAPFDKQVEGVISGLLHGRASPEFRKAARALRPASDAADSPDARQGALRELIVLALGSPEFQRR